MCDTKRCLVSYKILRLINITYHSPTGLNVFLVSGQKELCEFVFVFCFVLFLLPLQQEEFPRPGIKPPSHQSHSSDNARSLTR